VTQYSKAAKDNWLLANHHKRAAINRGWTIRKVYGISVEQYDDMILAQGNRCAICQVEFVGVKEEPKNLRPHIDHNHETKWVRGLLCGHCNFGIGHFEDKIERLQAAVEYLVEGATPTEFVFTPVANPKRKTNSGIVCTQEWRDNISATKRGNSPAWNKGKVWSEEVKKKMRKPKKRKDLCQPTAPCF
jgi:hypothetical protein